MYDDTWEPGTLHQTIYHSIVLSVMVIPLARGIAIGMLEDPILARVDQRSVRVVFSNRVPMKPVLGVEDGQRFVVDEAAGPKNLRVEVELRLEPVNACPPIDAVLVELDSEVA